MDIILKQEILSYLENQTAFLDLNNLDEVFTSQKLAEIFGLKRNTMSHYLNRLSTELLLVKVNTRPVYYFHKEAFEKQYFHLSKNVYQSISEIQKEQPVFKPKKDFFSLMIGYDKSLSRCIEQIKAAIDYPENGLPVLITGESGTGKSFLVHLIYNYCLENDLIEDDAPFITVNCAQYANNPELLTSNLFGYVKGAFTGAEVNKKGAFEAANNGILFLDEVHRLNAEGQEKLFTFLDQGVIYRVGDTDQPIPIKTRIFFATTESLESSFLNTFIRRIPIQITLPSLDKRSHSERLELVYSFFISEQRKIGKPITVTGQVLSLLSDSAFKGNIGELKSDVQVAVARAFSNQKNESGIKVRVYDLPDNILRADRNNLHQLVKNDISFNDNVTLNQLVDEDRFEQQKIFTAFKKMLLEFEKSNCSLKSCESVLKSEVDGLFDFILFKTNHQDKRESLVYMTKYINDAFDKMESSYQIHFDGNSIFAISDYLFQKGNNRWVPEDFHIKQLIISLEQQVKENYPASYHYMERILDLCQPKIDLDITSIDKIILSIYLKKTDWSKKSLFPRAIIVAHGYATASSIANVANKFLQKDIFESFDMPLDVTPQEIASEILKYSQKNDVSNGLVILVDMGSLKEIYRYFPRQNLIPMVIMNNVTTPIAIAVGENLQKKLSLEQIVTKSKKEVKTEWKSFYPKDNKIKVIITTCFTGIGTATQISQLLENSLPKKDNLKVIPYEYGTLEKNKRKNSIFSMYNCIGVIGTADPNINGIPFISLENLISGNSTQELKEWVSGIISESEVEKFTESLIRNFSLKQVIDSVTILDTEKVMEEVDIFMQQVEQKLNEVISSSKCVALYVHIGCLIERLIRNEPIKTYSGLDKLRQCQSEALSMVKQSFSVVEKDYSVEIPESEVAYVYDILFEKLDKTGTVDDF